MLCVAYILSMSQTLSARAKSPQSVSTSGLAAEDYYVLYSSIKHKCSYTAKWANIICMLGLLTSVGPLDDMLGNLRNALYSATKIACYTNRNLSTAAINYHVISLEGVN